MIAGAFHDYMVGMISMRNRGGQTPDLIKLFLGRRFYVVYTVFVCLLLLLIGVALVLYALYSAIVQQSDKAIWPAGIGTVLTVLPLLLPVPLSYP